MRELLLAGILLIAAGVLLVVGAKKVSAKAELNVETVTAQVSEDTPQSRLSQPQPSRKRVRIAAKDIRLDRGFDFWEPHIIACESGGNPTADNPRSSASGLFQIIDSTWAGHGGYARAKDAPPEIQREKARLLFDSSGLRPWFADSRAKRCILGRV